MRLAFTTFLAFALLIGCTQFPEVDAAMQARGYNNAFPKIAPIDAVLGDDTSVRLDEQSGASLQARAAWLRTRAVRLRRETVLSDSERARLLSAVARHGF